MAVGERPVLSVVAEPAEMALEVLSIAVTTIVANLPALDPKGLASFYAEVFERAAPMAWDRSPS